MSLAPALGASLFFSGSFVAGKLAIVELGPLTITLYRYVIALVFLVLMQLSLKRKVFNTRLRDVPAFFLLGILGVVGYHYFFFSSLQYTAVTNTAIINALSPLVTGVLAAAVTAERMRLPQYLGILVSVFGTLLLVSSGSPFAMLNDGINRGDGLMLLAVCSWAGYGVIVRSISVRYDSMDLTTMSILAGVVGLVPLTLVSELPLRSPASAGVLLSILYMGIIASGVGYLLYNRSIAVAGATTTAAVVYSAVPIWVATLSFAMFDESITAVMVVSCVFIVIGIRLLLKTSTRSVA